MSTFKVDTLQSTTGGLTELTGQIATKSFFTSFEEGTVNKSLNISSGVDNGAGDGTYSFTNNFSDTQYAAVSGTSYRRVEYHDGIFTGSIRYITTDPNASATNLVGYAEDSGLSVIMTGDLA